MYIIFNLCFILVIRKDVKEMLNKKLGVFISSTFEDLQPVRQEAILSILNAGHIPMGMEFFQIGTSKIEAIENGIKNCDVYLIILGGKYGQVIEANIQGVQEDDIDKDMSYVGYEYHIAKKYNKEIIAFELSNQCLGTLIQNSSDKNALEKFIELTPARRKKQDGIKNKVKAESIVAVGDIADLKQAISNALGRLVQNHLLGGWIHSYPGIMTWEHYIDLVQSLANKLNAPESANGYHYNTIVGINSGGTLTADLLSKKKSQNFPILSLYSNLEVGPSDFSSLKSPFSNRHVLSALRSKESSRILLVDSIVRSGSTIRPAYNYIHEKYPDKIIRTAVLIVDPKCEHLVDYYVEKSPTQGIQFPYHGLNYVFQ